MSSEAVNSSSAAEGLTPAQKLMERHEHHPTVEDVVDEEDVAHPPPPPSAPLKTDASDAPATTLSEKAAGKQKVEDAPAPSKKSPANVSLNTASEEAFPALGPVKPRAPASVPPAWGKKPASVSTNGVNGSGLTPSTTTSRASTPASGMGTPVSMPVGRGPALPTMALPGKHMEQISFHPSQLIPRQQLKKPLNDIIRDINKRSKAKLEHKSGPGGLVLFQATGPVDAVRQSLKDIANEIGSKVRFPFSPCYCCRITDQK